MRRPSLKAAASCLLAAFLVFGGANASVEASSAVGRNVAAPLPECGDTVMVNGNLEDGGMRLKFKVIGVDLWAWLGQQGYGTLGVKAQTAGYPEKQYGRFNASATGGARTPELSHPGAHPAVSIGVYVSIFDDKGNRKCGEWHTFSP